MGFAPAGLRFGGVSRLCRLVSCLVFPDVEESYSAGPLCGVARGMVEEKLRKSRQYG